MTVPAYYVKVDLDGDDTAETEVRSWVLDMSIKRGRSKELGAVETGVCTLLLDNSDGRFNPQYGAGPYYGLLEISNKVQVTAVLSAVTYYLFTGYITKIKPDVARRTCAITCLDLFNNLRNFHLNLALTLSQWTGNRVDAVLAAFDAGVAAAASVDVGKTPMAAYYAKNTDALSALQDIVDHELGGIVFVAGDGTIKFRDRQSRGLLAASGTVTRMQGLEYERDESQLYNQVILQGGAFDVGIADSQIWSFAPLPVKVLKGATLILDPNYTSPSIDVITPVSGTDFLANVLEDGTGVDLSASIASTFTDYGGGAAWELTNNSTNDAWFTLLQIRGTPLGLSTGLRSVTATAGASPLTFTKTFRASYPWIVDPVLLQDFADYIISHYNSSQPQITVTLQPHLDDSDAQLIRMLAGELNQRITITDATFTYSSQVDGDFFIESIEHRVTTGNTFHETKWLMTTFSNDGQFVLDTSQLNGIAVLGY